MTTDLESLNAAVQADKGANKSVKNWINAATPLIQAPPPVTPPVTPPPLLPAWTWDVQSLAIDNTSSVADLVANCKQGVAFSCSVPLATATGASPGYAIQASGSHNLDAKVYIPPGASPQTVDSDGHLWVLDPVHGRESEFEHAAFSNGQWSCDEGCSYPQGAVTVDNPLGCITAAGTPLGRGLVTPQDLATGVTHTLVYSMDYTKISSRTPVYPGNTKAQAFAGPAGNLRLGSIVRLPKQSVPTTLDPLSAYVMKCLINDGMVLRDGGSNVDVYGLDVRNMPSTYPTWASVGVNLSINGYALILSNAIPWSQLEACAAPTP